MKIKQIDDYLQIMASVMDNQKVKQQNIKRNMLKILFIIIKLFYNK